jgi:hypothetical protein
MSSSHPRGSDEPLGLPKVYALRCDKMKSFKRLQNASDVVG